jgi:hypothetical protein
MARVSVITPADSTCQRYRFGPPDGSSVDGTGIRCAFNTDDEYDFGFPLSYEERILFDDNSEIGQPVLHYLPNSTVMLRFWEPGPIRYYDFRFAVGWGESRWGITFEDILTDDKGRLVLFDTALN